MARSRREYLKVICTECGARRVKAHVSPDRALIVCESCGETVFSYYRDVERQRQGEVPHPREDAFFLRLVERDLRQQVTPAAQVVFEYLRRYRRDYGYAPTLREIKHNAGFSSASIVRRLLIELEDADLIERDYGVARGIRIKEVG